MTDRKMILKSMRMCRFCLTDQEPLSSIYERDNKLEKNSTPLHLQIMACVSIEVFPNDGMPQLICNICRLQTDRSYKFKANCKRSDDALKLFIATGLLNKPTRSISEVLELTDSDIEKSTRQDETESPRQAKPSSAQSSDNEVQEIEEGEVITEETIDDDAVEDDSFEDGEPGEVFDDEEMKGKSNAEKVTTDVFPCKFCERSFPLKQLLDIHQLNHSRERNFPCKTCSKSFLSKYDLAKHETIHTGEKPFSCVVCLKTFARATLLHRHEKIHIEVPKYLCNSCDKTFLHKEALDRHEAMHKKYRPFSCPLCNKRFTFKQGMQRHMETHKQNKPHKCEYCEQSFDTPAKLARHIQSHAGMRPYPCKWCSRTFLLSHHLSRHLRSHYDKGTKVKPFNYKCSECTMEFRRKDGLIGHSTIHSMVSLKCIFCFKQFDDLNFVREHVKTHMEGRIYPCDKCDYFFITQKHLDDHELTHGHSDEEIEAEENQEENAENKDSIGLYEDQGEDIETSSSQKISGTRSENASIRRSQRVTKIKDYAQFIKEELGSESDNDDTEDDYDEDADLYGGSPPPKKMKPAEEETIRPINKPDGTKTYGKGIIKKVGVTAHQQDTAAQTPTSSADSTQSIDLPVKKMMNKTGEIVEMKIGEKIVKVQKVLMTKAEVQEMARQGKIKMKGGTMLLQQTVKKPVDTTTLPSPIVEAVGKSMKVVAKTLAKPEKEKKTVNVGSDESRQKEVAEDTKKLVRTYVKKGTVVKTKEAAVVEESAVTETVDLQEEPTEQSEGVEKDSKK